MSLRGLSPSQKIMGAARIRCEAEANQLLGRPDHAVAAELAHADRAESGVYAVLGEAQLGAGGEIVPHADAFTRAATYIDTVKSPSYVTVEASRSRLDLADKAGVLTSALDIAQTIDAKDSTEKNLAAQMALLHRVVMETGTLAISCIERANACIVAKDREVYSVQTQRAVNTIARASAEYQGAMLTLQKVRSGGKQSITVTHIQNTQVNSGGQAVISGGGAGSAAMGDGNGK